jgi:hypothetical protein
MVEPMPGAHGLDGQVPAIPLGTKSCGEAGRAGALTSVMNAVADALKEYGIGCLDMPLSPTGCGRRPPGRMNRWNGGGAVAGAGAPPRARWPVPACQRIRSSKTTPEVTCTV